MENVPEILKGERLILKRFVRDDARAIYYTYASRSEILKYVSWPVHKSIKDTEEYLTYAIDGWENGIDHSYGIRTRENNEFIGGIGFVDEGGRVYIGYVIGPDYWGLGYATEAVSILMTFLKTRRLGKLYSMTDVEHKASQRVLEKNGFVREAVLANWCRFPNQGNRWKAVAMYDYPLEGRDKV